MFKSNNQVVEEDGSTGTECTSVVIVFITEDTEDKEKALYKAAARAAARADRLHFVEANLRLMGVSVGEVFDQRILKLARKANLIRGDSL